MLKIMLIYAAEPPYSIHTIPFIFNTYTLAHTILYTTPYTVFSYRHEEGRNGRQRMKIFCSEKIFAARIAKRIEPLNLAEEGFAEGLRKEGDSRPRRCTIVCRSKMSNRLLEMRTFSRICTIFILLTWLCCCYESARIIGDGKYIGSAGGLLQNDVLQCNNTVQGRYLLTDSRGYVCSIMAANPATACCPERGEQYSCQGCNSASQCCDSYEYCVSCCLNPTRTALEIALKTKLGRQATAGMCTSLFDYCSGRCRHNSESVVHENAYMSGEHHCYSNKSVSAGDALDAGAGDELAEVSVIVGRQGLSCDATCNAQNLSCKEEKLAVINNCAELQKYNRCRGLCIASSGPDQPAMVVSGAPKHMHPDACLYNSQASQLSCEGYHPFTRRLCPCA